MTDDRDRTFVHSICKTISGSWPEGHRPGLALVILVNEHPEEPGRIEVDASFQGGDVYTAKGAVVVQAFGYALRAAIDQACAKIAGSDGEVIDRLDVQLGPKGHA